MLKKELIIAQMRCHGALQSSTTAFPSHLDYLLGRLPLDYDPVRQDHPMLKANTALHTEQSVRTYLQN